MLGSTEGDADYKKFIAGQLLGLYQHLGFENKETDDSRDLLLRSSVIKTMCKLGHEDCEEKAVKLFRSWRNQDCKIFLNSIEKFDSKTINDLLFMSFTRNSTFKNCIFWKTRRNLNFC
jgi:hypothetical protein